MERSSLAQPEIQLSPIAQDILSYLVEHPSAQDTLEGIVQWWLLEQAIKRQMKQVHDELHCLVGRGLLVERTGQDGQVCYRVNRRRLREIQTLLEPSGESAAPKPSS